MIWKTTKLSTLHLSRAKAIFLFDCCQFRPSWMFGLKMEFTSCADLVGGTTLQICIFSWPNMIESMIWNTFKLSALHLSCATAVFVVDLCQFFPSWLFVLKIEVMSCAELVGSTMLQSCFLLTYYDSSNDMTHFQTVCITPQLCHSHFCCWLLPIWP